MRFVHVIAIVATICAVLPVRPAGAATRTIVCHGSSSNPPGTYSGLGGGFVRVNYVKATNKPQDGLNPGECSWTDSPIEPAAPTTLCASNVGNVSVNFTNRGDIYGPSIFNRIKAAWLQRYYSDSDVLYATDVTANSVTNCLYVQGDAKDFILPTPRVRARPSPRRSGLPQ